jgi:hypothetical protein
MDPGRMRIRIRIRNAQWRINVLQRHYQARNERRRQAEQDEEVGRGLLTSLTFSYRNIMLKVTLGLLAIKGQFSQQEYLTPLPRWAYINLNWGLCFTLSSLCLLYKKRIYLRGGLN